MKEGKRRGGEGIDSPEDLNFLSWSRARKSSRTAVDWSRVCSRNPAMLKSLSASATLGTFWDRIGNTISTTDLGKVQKPL